MKLQEQTVYVAPDKEAIPITPSTTMTVHGCKVRVEKAYILTRDQLEQFGRELLERAARESYLRIVPFTNGEMEVSPKSITDVLPEFLNQTL